MNKDEFLKLFIMKLNSIFKMNFETSSSFTVDLFYAINTKT
jgi:hypothetical protein